MSILTCLSWTVLGLVRGTTDVRSAEIFPKEASISNVGRRGSWRNKNTKTMNLINLLYVETAKSYTWSGIQDVVYIINIRTHGEYKHTETWRAVIPLTRLVA